MLCKSQSIAQKRYQRDVMIFMSIYLVLVMCSAWFVKHGTPTHFLLYMCAVIPAVPVIALIARMARYLREETDEYQRLLRMESISGRSWSDARSPGGKRLPTLVRAHRRPAAIHALPCVRHEYGADRTGAAPAQPGDGR